MLAVSITIFLLFGHNCIQGYYWREYLGTIPNDALVAGKSINGHDLYIGQGYIKGIGIGVIQIDPNSKEVYAAIQGIHKVEKYIKLLCGPPQHFSWLKANHTHLHIEIADKTPVIGGHEDAYGHINVGRISYDGGTKVGKINSFWPEWSFFYFVDGDSEKRISTYEVLLYKRGTDTQGEKPQENYLDASIKQIFGDL